MFRFNSILFTQNDANNNNNKCQLKRGQHSGCHVGQSRARSVFWLDFVGSQCAGVYELKHIYCFCVHSAQTKSFDSSSRDVVLNMHLKTKPIDLYAKVECVCVNVCIHIRNRVNRMHFIILEPTLQFLPVKYHFQLNGFNYRLHHTTEKYVPTCAMCIIQFFTELHFCFSQFLFSN